MRVQKWWLEAVVLLFATGWLCLSTPVGKRSSLLPHSLTPESYELSLNPDIIRGVFHGVVVISGVAVAETSVIVLHCSNLLFNTTKLTDTTEGEEVAVLGVEEDEFLQQCHLSLNKTLRVDHEYKLTIEFMGIIGHDGFGLYKDFYKEGGVRKHEFGKLWLRDANLTTENSVVCP
ncbi:leucyl-cystinyl aminopeptidase-like [Macrosteles quadrilineatus]|uniref:leucyl-cystinyl aminopeptidase-like n=1 Tax=Macrosteles quadrilineatus TaxID=74068 RepID=UPI0023E23F94|nr:leucyl-cystinyl aminopeptidase-like [Macrosteles quadrilineatus]